MRTLLVALVACHTAGCLLPFCFPGRPRTQNLLAHGPALGASLLGIVLGMTGLFAPAPLTVSLASNLPFLTFAVRIDPLGAFFILTISLASLAASLYAVGYLAASYGRRSLALLGALYNGFLLSMTFVVIAD